MECSFDVIELAKIAAGVLMVLIVTVGMIYMNKD